MAEELREVVGWLALFGVPGVFTMVVFLFKTVMKAINNISAGPGDFVNIFVALTRAKGIPARIVSGYTVGHYGGTRQAWAEVYFKEYGWVTFDIKNSPVDITSLNSFYIVSANNSIRADSLTTTFDKIPTTGRVDTYFQVLNK